MNARALTFLASVGLASAPFSAACNATTQIDIDGTPGVGYEATRVDLGTKGQEPRPDAGPDGSLMACLPAYYCCTPGVAPACCPGSFCDPCLLWCSPIADAGGVPDP